VRASRLLLMLLLLQNRGRMTSAELAAELEVSRRTILRDIEALGASGLPVVVHHGRGGGFELGFNYRTRLTGLAADEAEALGVILAQPAPVLAAVGLEEAGARARTKLLESLPDPVRATAMRARARFATEEVAQLGDDARVPALAEAIRRRSVVRIRDQEPTVRTIHPVGLVLRGAAWLVVDALAPDDPVALAECGTVNISRRTF
jgi:predicted DNA-binding transcriptional regulator YafY